MLNRYGVHVEGVWAALDGTMFAWYAKFCSRASGNNSVVECDLAKVEVAGSNPVSRSIISFLAHRISQVRRRRQVVRQRSAKPPSPVQIRAAPPSTFDRDNGLSLEN